MQTLEWSPFPAFSVYTSLLCFVVIGQVLHHTLAVYRCKQAIDRSPMTVSLKFSTSLQSGWPMSWLDCQALCSPKIFVISASESFCREPRSLWRSSLSLAWLQVKDPCSVPCLRHSPAMDLSGISIYLELIRARVDVLRLSATPGRICRVDIKHEFPS